MAWWQTLLSIVGAVVTAAGAIAAPVFAWRASTHATDKTTAVQEKATAVEGFSELVRAMQSERTEDRERLVKLEDKLSMTEVRITALEADLRRERTLVGQLVDYARRLRAALRDHHIDIPEPPTEVRDKL